MSMNHPGYESLAAVLQAAYDQAATGKGAERHANDLPFHEQPMQQIARRRGIGFLLGQADKKTEEAQGMLERGERDAWRREILGAINYLAGALVYTDRQAERIDVTCMDSSGTVEASGSDGPGVRPFTEAPLPRPWTPFHVGAPSVGRPLEVRFPFGEVRAMDGLTHIPHRATHRRYVDA